MNLMTHPELKPEKTEKRTAKKRTTSFLPLARKSPNPILRFSPYAWAKLLAFRDYGPTEIAGFGVSVGDDPLFIEDFVTVKQSCTSVTVAMNDEAVADYFDEQVDHGRKPEQFARVWLHTHPGSSAHPSTTDEETFERVFGQCDWAIMAILARGGQTYARLRFNVGPRGPGGQMLIPVQVNFEVPFPGSDHQSWQEEYESNIIPVPLISLKHLLGEDRGAVNEGAMRVARDDNANDHHPKHFREEEVWDIHDLNDLQALAELEAELQDELNQQGIREEMEVSFDTR